VVVLRGLLLVELDSGLGGEYGPGLLEPDLLVVLDEREHVARGPRTTSTCTAGAAGSTSSDGRVSLWNGQTALKTFPAGVTLIYEPTTATMSLAALICFVSSTGSDGT
jgi:hypothetical protein